MVAAYHNGREGEKEKRQNSAEVQYIGDAGGAHDVGISTALAARNIRKTLNSRMEVVARLAMGYQLTQLINLHQVCEVAHPEFEFNAHLGQNLKMALHDART